MIGVDANVLLRLFVADDQGQHQRAVSFFSKRTPDDPAYIDLLVLAEFVWLLDRRYGYAMPAIVATLAELLDTADITIERADLVADVLQYVRAKVGLVDLLIAAKAEAAGCHKVVTFDRPAARDVPGMELIK
jgi:predicted nucleic-acid-binding protein